MDSSDDDHNDNEEMSRVVKRKKITNTSTGSNGRKWTISRTGLAVAVKE